jgi:hypothetical protein
MVTYLHLEAMDTGLEEIKELPRLSNPEFFTLQESLFTSTD